MVQNSEQFVFITYCAILFAEDGLPRLIISEIGTNFVAEIQDFFRKLNIKQNISSSYNH